MEIIFQGIVDVDVGGVQLAQDSTKEWAVVTTMTNLLIA
jgi:hypothetical protein